MHKKCVKSETNVNFNADKIIIISKGAEDANYELTFTAKLKPKKTGKNKRVRKELKKRIRKSVSGLYCQQGRCLHNASFSL
jgi:hypothetical protein